MSATTKTKVSVVIRVMPKGEDIDSSLPVKANGNQIVQKLLSDPSLGVPQSNSQGQISYKLLHKESGNDIRTKTLEESNVKDGHTLILTPDVIAG